MAVLIPKGQVMKNITNVPLKIENSPMKSEPCKGIHDLQEGVENQPETVRVQKPKKRNERERNRVKHINKTFGILKQHLPMKKAKLLSKADTLRAATDYIKQLKALIDNHDSMMEQMATMGRLQMPQSMAQHSNYINSLSGQQAHFYSRQGQYGGYNFPIMPQQTTNMATSGTITGPGWTSAVMQGGSLLQRSPVETGIIPEWCVT